MRVGRQFTAAAHFARRHWGWTLAALVFVFWWGIPLARQAYYDAETRKLCAMDGGARVFERVKLPAERFDEYGSVRIPLLRYAKQTDEFVFTWEVNELSRPLTSLGDLTLSRDHFQIIRRKDSKVLGEATSYLRRGGDPYVPWEPSSFRCPDAAGVQELIRLVFVK